MVAPLIFTAKNTVLVEPRQDKSVSFLPPPGFRLRRLILPMEYARRFVVTNVSFGDVPRINSQMMSPGAVPGVLFSEDAVPENYDFGTLHEGDEISVSATNISSEPSHFTVVFMGDTDLPYENLQLRRNFLGFGVTTVRPGLQANIAVQPVLPFRAERLVIPSSMVESFTISDIKVGANSQLRLSSPLPANLFTEQSPMTGSRGLALDTVHRSLFLTIKVNNISKVPCDFSCAFVGVFVNE